MKRETYCIGIVVAIAAVAVTLFVASGIKEPPGIERAREAARYFDQLEVRLAGGDSNALAELIDHVDGKPFASSAIDIVHDFIPETRDVSDKNLKTWLLRWQNELHFSPSDHKFHLPSDASGAGLRGPAGVGVRGTEAMK